MKARHAASMVLAACAAIMLSACGTPAQQASSPPSAAKPGTQAPHVQNPLNAQPLVDAPCTALTTNQVAALGVPESDPRDTTSGTGASCGWANLESGANLAIAWQDQNTKGLDVLYDQRQAQAYFSRADIEGYPGVFASESDDRSDGICVFNVGVSDKLAFFAQMQTQDQPLASQTCDIAKQAATQVIKNLKQKQGAS